MGYLLFAIEITKLHAKDDKAEFNSAKPHSYETQLSYSGALEAQSIITTSKRKVVLSTNLVQIQLYRPRLAIVASFRSSPQRSSIRSIK
jgi:hypothetical protein